MKYPGFVGPSYRSQSPTADIERLVNWYVARVKAQTALYPTPGMADFLVVNRAPVRGLFAQTGRAWVAADTVVSEFFEDMMVTDRGNLARDGNPVTMTTNGDGGNQLFITSGGHKYILDLNAPHTLTDVGPGVGGDVIMGDMLDGFFIALEPDRFSICDALNGLVWDPTQFRQRSAASDPWKAMKVIKDRLYLLGEFTSDLWYNAGDAEVPFAPIQGAQIREGIGAVFSAAEFKGTLVWLAQNRHGARTVQRATGYNATKISTEALDYALSTYARVDDAEALVYQELGVEHYVLNFPSANKSWDFNEDGGWAEVGTWNIGRGDYDVWHPRCHTFAFDKHLYGDRTTGAIFRGSVTLGLDASGAPLRRMRVAPVLDAEHARLYVDNLELRLDNGLGLSVGQGSDPTVMLQKTKTNGNTWGNERWRHAGRQGQWKVRVRWLRLGSGRDLAVRVIVTDPIPWRLTDALINQAESEQQNGRLVA